MPGCIVSCLLLVTQTGSAWSQTDLYPSRPIRILVQSAPGGAADFTARVTGQYLGDALKQTILIDNRPGASGVIATDFVAKAKPDGYTLLLTAMTTHGIGVHLITNAPYHPANDFAPVVHINTVPLILVVNQDVPVRSVQELIAMAKTKPGELNFAAMSPGSAPHLTAELFKAATGTDIVSVPYKGSGQGVPALVAGQVHVMFDGAPSLVAHIKSGRLRPLAAASARRNPLLPDLPTFAELGFKNIEVGLWYGLLAPAQTPKASIVKLNMEVNRFLALPEVRARFEQQGAEAVGGTPEQFAEFMRLEQARWGRLIKQIGLKIE